MLSYFYKFQYNDSGHSDLSALADKYIIVPLKAMAKDKFIERALSQWNSAGFREAVKMVYDEESGADELKSVVLVVVEQHAAELFDKKKQPGFVAKAAGVPAFLLDHTKRTAAKPARFDHLPVSDYADWYICSGKTCKDYCGIFALNPDLPRKFHITCPLRCVESGGKQDTWTKYRVRAGSERNK